MAFTNVELQRLYRQRAPWYDYTANLYYLLGFREQAYRRRAVAALGLRPGANVVEVGCGTGLNFRMLEAAIGPGGRIIGVDQSEAMLARAGLRGRQARWENVELRHCDAAEFEFPRGIDAVLSTFAITLIPEFDQIIQRAAAALRPGGRLTILDLKKPEDQPEWLVRLGVLVSRPFGVTPDLAERHPWESVRQHLRNVSLEDFYFGFAYLCAGEAKDLGHHDERRGPASPASLRNAAGAGGTKNGV
jgi:ubiquinone/menaquinone biosynthesis C-methylase UbiE